MDWEEIVKATILVMFLTIVAALVLYGFSAKQHKGYYLNDFSGEHIIYINWENAPDEAAFRTYDRKVALETLKQLNEMRKDNK